MKDFNRTVDMKCRVCGNDQFSNCDEDIVSMLEAPDDTKVCCSECGTVFTKAELIADNEELINSCVNGIEHDAIKEIENMIKKTFK